MKLGEGSSLIVIATVDFDDFIIDKIGVGACEEGDEIIQLWRSRGIMGLW